MKKIVLGIIFTLTFALSVSTQQDVRAPSESVQTVDYCLLRKEPERYNGKEVRVNGIYLRSYEISAFYSTACVDDSRYETWVDRFSLAKRGSDQETSAIVSTFLSGKAGSELEVTMTGVFRAATEGGGFGHLNRSKFQLEVSFIEKAKLLPDEVAGCRPIDQTKPFHYLAYEKLANGTPPRYEKSKQPRSENLIYLRLANNSTCSINVPTVNIADRSDLKDQSEVPVIYDLSSPCARVSEHPITKVGKTLSTLAPGKSIYLAIPFRFLTQEPYEIRVPFYSDTFSYFSYYQPFYFSRHDLPEGLPNEVDCTKY